MMGALTEGTPRCGGGSEARSSRFKPRGQPDTEPRHTVCVGFPPCSLTQRSRREVARGRKKWTNLQEPTLYLIGDGEVTKESFPHFLPNTDCRATIRQAVPCVVGVEQGLVRLELPAGPLGREWRKEEKG